MQLNPLWLYVARAIFAPGRVLRSKYESFKRLLASDDRSLEIIADLQDVFHGVRPVDRSRVAKLFRELRSSVAEMVFHLRAMRPLDYKLLHERLELIAGQTDKLLQNIPGDSSPPYSLPLEAVAGKYALAGGKAANLGRVAVETGFSVPKGIVITANAFNLVIESNGLRQRLNNILSGLVLCKHSEFSRKCREMQSLVEAAVLPAEVLDAIANCAGSLGAGSGGAGGETFLAVRSSAWAEDGKHTFAGQYDSVLNVSPADAARAYLKVLASKYSPQAVTYRILRGLSDEEIPMAVLILPMIRAEFAGVAYSLDPEADGGVSVHAVPGLGHSLVDGSASAQMFHFNRRLEPERLNSAGDGAAMKEETAKVVASMSLELERLFGEPQDVEWAADAQGRVWALQSRPFRAEPVQSERDYSPDVEPLLEGLIPVSMGAGSGKIVYLHEAQDPVEVPKGSVVVIESLAPGLTRCLDRIEAVIGTSGGRASHFATVAREVGFPVVVGDPLVVAGLEDGQLVTVDAANGCVYDGRLDELVAEAEETRDKARRMSLGSYSDLVPLITTLNLADAESPDFTPENCRSMHDLIRFMHEKGVQEMFDLVGRGGRGMSRSRKLMTELPLSLYVLDLESDFKGLPGRSVRLDDLASEPMRVLWQGLEGEETKWSETLFHADWEEMDRVSAGIFSKDAKFLSSYCLVAPGYVHLMIKFGYHFSVLDSVCVADSEKNYVKFRFKGGGADMDGRLLRLRFIERVLKACGFVVNIRNDTLDASLSRKTEDSTRHSLHVLGRVMARTRLMDMQLGHEGEVEVLADEFIETC